ncbi:solute carrier family 25 member 38 [Diaporthe helianthi]|uniref:Mitochondrial glycine transporter n=1 Tax=Diaporthe helianthi TaxID=158607 RepID=A0A2P5IAM7_DIAHE|nr:solute carrier family 25 member 38 [Diaporthe helianthi]
MSSDGAPKAKSKSIFHFVAGLSSGLLSAVLLQPIDLLKTRVQQSGHHSLTAAFREIQAQPRFLPALWRGATPSALRTGFGSALYFTSLNAIRNNVSRVPFLAADGEGRHHSSSLVKLSNTGNLLAGVVARTFAGMTLMPLTVIKVRYESNLYSYGSIAAAGRDIFRTERLRGFFSGFGATAMRDAPYAGLYVLFYEQSKKRLSSLAGGGDSADGQEPTNSSRAKISVPAMGVSTSATINFGSGVIAGAACSVVSNPFDAVKTRIQLQPGVYRNTLHAARMMVTREGLRSLADGLALRMSRKAMSSALAWTVYEELIRRAEVTLNPKKRNESVL